MPVDFFCSKKSHVKNSNKKYVPFGINQINISISYHNWFCFLNKQRWPIKFSFLTFFNIILKVLLNIIKKQLSYFFTQSTNNPLKLQK